MHARGATSVRRLKKKGSFVYKGGYEVPLVGRWNPQHYQVLYVRMNLGGGGGTACREQRNFQPVFSMRTNLTPQ